VFIVATITSVDWSLLSFSDYPPFSDIVASVALTFFAFLGFSVITFSAGDLADPARGLPRAMYTALGLAGGLYILIAVGVFGTSRSTRWSATAKPRWRRRRDRRSATRGS
jgi:amino acid transporter